ncbi:HAD-IA family hydrolase [uncultured Jannaschia sp.]|uniref:HAD-IA family hydrolase n=1 Tax=uncultured Jannaschia sp. TaxID=293347 RepID=UPI00261A04AD|nr:HAD-IA family hydrolase [uncultured Jannaschia sp.]
MSEGLAIFDVDGTLVDSQAVIVATMAQAFAAVDRPVPDRREILSGVGLSLPILVARLTPGLDEATRAEIVAGYRSAYGPTAAEYGETMLYPGVVEGLERLRSVGVILGIATGKSRRGLDRLIAAKGWDDLFATLQCADDHPSKPHPSMIERALLETATEPGRAVMVGDTTFDAAMAAAAGVPMVGVDWGFHTADALAAAGASPIVSDFASLAALIEARLT